MRTSIQGPLRYIQEAGILRQAGPLIAQVGGRALVLLTRGSMARVGATLEQTMVQAGCACLRPGALRAPAAAPPGPSPIWRRWILHSAGSGQGRNIV